MGKRIKEIGNKLSKRLEKPLFKKGRMSKLGSGSLEVRYRNPFRIKYLK